MCLWNLLSLFYLLTLARNTFIALATLNCQNIIRFKASKKTSQINSFLQSYSTFSTFTHKKYIYFYLIDNIGNWKYNIHTSTPKVEIFLFCNLRIDFKYSCSILCKYWTNTNLPRSLKIAIFRPKFGQLECFVILA